jgi:endonuclease YncB( thermonuclease family)
MKRVMNRLILIIFTLLAIPLAAVAQDAPVLPTLGIEANDAYPLRQGTKDRTVSSVDGAQLHLVDGQTIDLSGIWIPQGAGYDPGDDMVRAKMFLDELLDKPADKKILLYQTPTAGKGRITRLGHELAHVVRKNGNIWLQGALVANGLAQVWPTPSNPELAEKMYALEDQARTAGKGLWSPESQYRQIKIGDAVPNLERFAVAEGTVQRIAMVNNVTYLNFGPDWKKDFTIGIPSTVRQVLARNKIDVMKLQGQRVRARGWVRYYNGPYIELEDQIHLQTLDQKRQNNVMPGAPHLSSAPRKEPSAPIVNNPAPVKSGTEAKDAP